MTTTARLREALALVEEATGANFALEQKVGQLLYDDPPFPVPPWSASRDAVTALIEREMPGHTRQIETTPSICRATIWLPPEFEEMVAGRADTEEALVLLAAYLKARIAEQEKETVA